MELKNQEEEAQLQLQRQEAMKKNAEAALENERMR
jgi:hypothetical protein